MSDLAHTWTLEKIKRLVDDKAEESRFLEFKETLDKQTLVKEATAFSNADGGELILGVREQNSVAVILTPVKKDGVGERIEQIVESNTQPKIESFEVTVIDDDRDNSGAYVVVTFRKSPRSPHMDTIDRRYYIRREKISEPMLDNEVRILMFKRGIADSLVSEIKSNKELAQKTVQRVGEFQQLELGSRKLSLFIPFQAEAWRAFQYSGYMSIAAPELIGQLVKVYNQIHEINSIIEFANIRYTNEVVTTPIDDHSASIGIWVPELIRQNLQSLQGQLEQVKRLVEEMAI